MSLYKLLRPIGRGGMGTVYEAETLLPGNQSFPVACKVMHGDLRERESYAAMFHREAAINLRISNNHPGLVSVYHHFQDSADRLYMSLELVRGCNLSALVRDHGHLPFAVVRFIARRVLGTLAYVHEQGVLHRDLSPCNVLLSIDGEVKISDLGLAKPLADGQAETSDIRGTLSYASPESILRRTMDARADLYSFGAMLYELLGGSPPFGRGLDLATLLERLEDWRIAELPEDVPDDLRGLAMGLLKKDPDERRPRSAAEALESVRHAEDMTTREDLACMVRQTYERAEAERKRHSRDRGIGRVDVVDVPDVIRASADPLGDTEPENPAERTETTNSAHNQDAEGASLSGPGHPGEPGEKRESETRAAGPAWLARLGSRAWRSRAIGLAMVAMLALGYLGHAALDIWREQSAQTAIESTGEISAPIPGDRVAPEHAPEPGREPEHSQQPTRTTGPFNTGGPFPAEVPSAPQPTPEPTKAPDRGQQPAPASNRTAALEHGANGSRVNDADVLHAP